MFKLTSSYSIRDVYCSIIVFILCLMMFSDFTLTEKLSCSLLLLFTATFTDLNPLEHGNIMLLKANKWLFLPLNGPAFEGELQGDSIICSWFCLLILKSKQSKIKTYLIWFDMLNSEQFHRLQLQLKGYLD